ncbi:MAG: YdeI/OmpD-associated family protein [Myxococcales bacterium]|nr:YdeI/OmpD-associated family protein [Myxococcales bacterium]
MLFFETPAAFRRWLKKHHRRSEPQWVGFHKKGAGRASITWEESVDEALCFGWIDGLRKSIDEASYRIRFSPRKPTSRWSQRNVDRVEAMEAAGKMTEAGRAAYAKRSEARTGVYSYEQRYEAELEPAMKRRFQADAAAWAWFSKRPPSYRAGAIHWIVSAKREATRERRLETLIECSREEQPIPSLRPYPSKKG